MKETEKNELLKDVEKRKQKIELMQENRYFFKCLLREMQQ